MYYAKWRDAERRQIKRRLGPAWVVRDGEGWKKRRGRAPDDHLDQRAAFAVMDRMIREHATQVALPKPRGPVTFACVAEAWLHHLEHIQGAKPSTLSDYRYMLRAPRARPRKRGSAPQGRIMRAFGTRPLDQITAIDVKRWLAELDEAGISARTINKHRQLVASVFEFGIADGEYGVAENPVRATAKRREPDPKPIDTYSPEEVLALARAAREGRHRNPHRPAVSDAERADRAREDEQDAALFIVAAFTGLRAGELLALRWRHVRFEDARLLVERAISAGQESSTKPRKWRVVPLADQAAAVLARLGERERPGPRQAVSPRSRWRAHPVARVLPRPR